jgi:molecular chaperone GrpE
MEDSSGLPGYTVKDRRWWARDDEDEEKRERPPTVIEALEARIADRDRRIREISERHQEALDELARARSRIERDAEREVERKRREFLGSLIPVLDDLDRALAAAGAAPAGAAEDPLVQGVELVRGGFLERLRAHGVERAVPTGEAFDPAHHEAISVVAADPAHPPGTVIETVLPGYTIGGEALRPAHVVVAR